jgi:hypothetical protein
VPRSKLKCTLVEIVLVPLSYLRASVVSRRPSGETTSTEPVASMEPSCQRYEPVLAVRVDPSSPFTSKNTTRIFFSLVIWVGS